MQQLKCVIFDMDGTIADTLPLCVEAFRRVVEPFLKRPVTDQEILAAFGPSEEGTMKKLIPDHADEGVKYFLEQYRLLHRSMCPQPFDGIRELFNELKTRKIYLALVTGKGLKSLQITLEILGLEHIFDIIETGSPYRPNKPEGLRNVLQQLNLQPQDTVYIGDAPSDIQATRSVSIPIFSAAWASTAEPEKLQAAKPDKILFSISELRHCLIEML
ncbi:MAG: HAD family hydrolase [Planctomycetaceae bacterium]|nr:HAD family hydrolase [Planctomycetaceae bacterium]